MLVETLGGRRQPIIASAAPATTRPPQQRSLPVSLHPSLEQTHNYSSFPSISCGLKHQPLLSSQSYGLQLFLSAFAIRIFSVNNHNGRRLTDPNVKLLPRRRPSHCSPLLCLQGLRPARLSSLHCQCRLADQPDNIRNWPVREFGRRRRSATPTAAERSGPICP
jgi:hypothetical protein